MSSTWPFGLFWRMTTTLVLRGPIARDDIPKLCERVRLLLESRPGSVVCDVAALANPDAVVIEALARLQLTARGLGFRLSLVHACSELESLIALLGLSDVLALMAGSGVEALGQTEEREQVRGIEEEADPRDPVA